MYRKKTELKNNVKFNPHLTKKRGKLFHETIQLTAKLDCIDFAYANIHGDVCVRLTAAVDGTESISLQSTSQLLKKLSDLRLVVLDQEGNLAE